MYKLLTGKKLEEEAIKLGVDIQGERIHMSSSGHRGRADDSELQRRVIEAQRHVRESRSWWLAVITAIVSAITLIAVLIK